MLYPTFQVRFSNILVEGRLKYSISHQEGIAGDSDILDLISVMYNECDDIPLNDIPHYKVPFLHPFDRLFLAPGIFTNMLKPFYFIFHKLVYDGIGYNDDSWLQGIMLEVCQLFKMEYIYLKFWG